MHAREAKTRVCARGAVRRKSLNNVSKTGGALEPFREHPRASACGKRGGGNKELAANGRFDLTSVVG